MNEIVPTATLESWDKPLCIIDRGGVVKPCRLACMLNGNVESYVVAVPGCAGEYLLYFRANGNTGGNRVRNITVPKKTKIVPWNFNSCPWPETDIILDYSEQGLLSIVTAKTASGLNYWTWEQLVHNKIKHSPDRGKTWLPCGIEMDDD